MKAIFMGTPDFAVPCLERLINIGVDVAAVFTQPDKPVGRGYKLTPPPVKISAENHKITVYQPEKLKTPETEKLIESLKPDIIFVVAYGKILSQKILDIPKLGCINIHGSLLPLYRGSSPIQYSVLNGDKITGVTSMYMDAGMDTGDIIMQIKTPIGENETSGELFDRLSVIGADCIEKTVESIENGSFTRTKQDESRATYTKILDKGMSFTSFDDSAQNVHNKIRGLSPWPCATAELNGTKIKLFSSVIVEKESQNSKSFGKLLDDKKFIVTCKTGSVEILSVQAEGSKRMSGEEFLRGKRLKTGTEFDKKEK